MPGPGLATVEPPPTSRPILFVSRRADYLVPRWRGRNPVSHRLRTILGFKKRRELHIC
jgi:hypothetical protein